MSYEPALYEENGIIRSTVFPNNIREIRISKGHRHLRPFLEEQSRFPVTYTRLAKIERGQVVPTPIELCDVADLLGVSVSDLLIDPTTPGFDIEAWAREHVEASLSHTGGDIRAMRLGAAIRLRRHERKETIENVMHDCRIPAATLSRLENAAFTIEEIDRTTKRRIAKYFGLGRWQDVMEHVYTRTAANELTDTMIGLFARHVLLDRRHGQFLRLQHRLEQMGRIPVQAPETIAA